jgi:hypothetical protein
MATETTKPELSAYASFRPSTDAGERREIARRYSAHLPPMPGGLLWSESDLDAMKAAFIKRFDENLPSTETLMAVAAIGYRIALARNGESSQ